MTGPVASASCAGKAFENHQRPQVNEYCEWTCPDCGDGGRNFGGLLERLTALLPLLSCLQERMLHEGALFLVPTDGATGALGTFYGLDLMRAPGLAAPMIALPALKVLSQAARPPEGSDPS